MMRKEVRRRGERKRGGRDEGEKGGEEERR